MLCRTTPLPDRLKGADPLPTLRSLVVLCLFGIVLPGTAFAQGFTVNYTVGTTQVSLPSDTPVLPLTFGVSTGVPASAPQNITLFPTAQPPVNVIVSVNNPGITSWLQVNPTGPLALTGARLVSVSVTTVGLSAGTYTGSLQVTSFPPISPGFTVNVSLTVTSASNTPTPPSVTSVVNLASGEQSFAPGSLAAISGANLVGSLQEPVTVRVNGRLAAILASTPDRLAVQLPVEETDLGSAPLLVTRGNLASVPKTITLRTYAPGIFVATSDNLGSIWHADGSPVTADSPAQPGEALSLLCTGLGQTSPVVPTGTPAPANPSAMALTTPAIIAGGKSATVQSATLDPGTMGKFRVFFVLPSSLPSGTNSLSLQIGGRTSNTVSIPVAGFAISGLSPNAVPAGQPAFTLTVSGASFVPGSVVRWNGIPLATTFWSGVLLIASVPDTLVANPGAASITVLNPNGAVSDGFTFTIQPRPLSILTGSSLVNGSVGVAYSQALAATGGITPYKGWKVVSGRLPPGVSLTSLGGVLTGLLNGTPTTPGTYVFTVQITDGSNNIETKQLSVTIGANPITLSATGVVNAASYAGGSISPGELVTVFGSFGGPDNLVGLQLDNRGFVSNNLAGNQVLFDGVPGPMIYAIQGQFSAVVPYSVSGRNSTQVQVVYPGGSSNPVSVPVSATLPGLFTINSSGKGQGAIVNQDGTINSTRNPARVGSTVFVYGTGEGQTFPSGIDGKPGDVRPPLPLTPPVTATIGGLGAQVVYAGGVPGLVSGVLQVNVQIPPGVASGSAVPIVINVGGRSTQTGVTLAIR